jgi:purine catabolism regulator
VSHRLELLAARVRGEALALVVVPVGPDCADPAGWLAATLPVGPAVVTVGPVVSLPGAGYSLREAHDSLPMAALLGEDAVATRDLSLVRLLGRLDDRALRRLAEDALAPLLAWDATYGSELVRTLAGHLRHGGSRSRTAEVLHVHRQSLYQRL